ncbi:MAG: hypothetical protein ACOCVM_05325 [Desulfovibrionaceae bacterium]
MLSYTRAMFGKKGRERERLAVACFDLVGADYGVYASLREQAGGLGLANEIADDDGRLVRLPSTVLAGRFRSPDPAALRNRLYVELQRIFEVCGARGALFVFVSDQCVWAGMSPPDAKK